MSLMFNGQTAVVTGVSKGLGRLCATYLASHGANIVVHDYINQSVVEAIVKEIKAAGGRAVADHSTPDQAGTLIQTAIDNFGRVDILLYSATTENSPVWQQTSQEDWDSLLNPEFKLSYKTVHAAWPHLKKQKYGRILSISTLGGQGGWKASPVTSAAKYGQLGFLQTIAREGAKYNILASALATDTNMETIFQDETFGMDSDAVPRSLASLLHASNKSETGHLYILEGSQCRKLRWQRAAGTWLNPNAGLTPGSILSKWADVNDFTNATYADKSKDFAAVLERTQKLGEAPRGKDIRFDGKVVLVTGAGGGLGRAYALLFAKLGARVVVNDMRDPSSVVSEIKDAGGEAHAVIHSVSEGEKIVAETVQTYGRIDVVVNNAGFVRDKSIANMTDDLWDAIMEVHLNGLYKVTKAAWPHFIRQGYGRVVNISSTSGIYGNFGQSNYSLAKCAIVGISQALAMDGAQHNILVNAVAPVASTAGLADAIVGSSAAILPEYSAPFVVLLCSDAVPYPATGGLYEIGAGWHARTRLEANLGINWRSSTDFDAGTVSNALNSLAKFEQPSLFYPGEDDENGLRLLNKQAYRSGALARIEAAKQARVEGSKFEYTQRDVILYNLSLGAKRTELPLIYEDDPNFQVLPTYGSIPWFRATLPYTYEEILPDWDATKFLHGEIYLELRKHPVPTSASLITHPRLLHVLDKKKAAVVTTSFTTRDAQTGEAVFYNESSIYVRDAGGFGGSPDIPQTAQQIIPPTSSPPSTRPPDFVRDERTSDEQAALYRLNGDTNDLHIDPAVAQRTGFPRPILHGLAFFGIAGKHIYQHYGAYRNIRVRFVGTVLPGQTLRTEAWKSRDGDDDVVLFRMTVLETGKLCISGGRAEMLGGRIGERSSRL